MRAGRNPKSIRMAPWTYWYVLKHVRRRCAPQLGLVSVCSCAAFKRAAAQMQLHARRIQIACGSCTAARFVPLT